MIFDQYSRYHACGRLLYLAGYRRGKRVLDVGCGPEALFGRFLREGDVTYVDPLIPEGSGARHLTGDVFSPGLAKRRFSYVTAIDVFEHVPVDARRAFLERLTEMADEGVVLAFPSSDNPSSVDVDQRIDDKYRAIFGHDYPWLAEHFENGLPSVEETCATLEGAGWHCQVVGHGRADWLVRLLGFSICVWDVEFLKKIVLVASERFNHELADHDFQAPYYRSFIVATRSPLPVPLMLTPAHPELDVDRVFEEILEDCQEKFMAEVLRKLHEQSSDVAAKQAKLVEISDWAVGLKTLLDEKAGDLDAAEKSLVARGDDLMAANVKIQELSGSVAGLKVEIEEQAARLEDAERCLAARGEELAAVKAASREVSVRSAELEAAAAERLGRLDVAERMLANKTVELADAEGRINDLTRRAVGLTRQADQTAAQLEDMERQLAGKTADLASTTVRLQEASALAASCKEAIEQRDRQLSDAVARGLQLEDALRAARLALMEATERQNVMQNDLALQKHREASMRAKLMEISDWASRIDGQPMAHGLRKRALGVARTTLRALPVTIATKQRLRDSFLSLTRSLRTRRGAATAFLPSELSGGDCLHVALPSCGLQGRDIFVFAVIDWHFRIQRPQHIARSLAEAGRRVFYFSNHFVDANEPGYEIERLSPVLDIYQIKLNVKGAPAIYFAPPTPEAEAMLEASIARVILDFGAVSTVSIVQHAYWYPLVTRLPNNYRVYDCMDHHEGFGNVPEKLVEIEKSMLSGVDLVTVTSSWLDTFAREYNRNVAVVRNAAEYGHFATRPEQVYLDPAGRRIIGYYGAIAEWFDLDLLRTVAESFSDCLVLIVGDDTVGAARRLSDLTNVVFTGEVPYATLPYYLYAFDVSLLPFKVIPLTLATNPVKVYEYLAAGKPVVSVDLPEMTQFEDLVWRAGSHQQFVAHVGRALEPASVDAAVVARRQAFSAEQTWLHRAREFTEALESVQLPRVSVVILTYNNLDLTKACLQSIVERSDYPNLEIIVVDNASSDDTPAYLREFGMCHPGAKVILNDTNLGFAAGNNVGLAAATGDYLVLLNNDTVVTRGWIMTMLRHLQVDATVGIVGPRTNNIGNEARAEMRYRDPEEMPMEALRMTLASMGKLYFMRNAAFFCVMLPRSTYERCGPISEDYGRGFFEDDDYCRKVEAVGLRVACADDVFVHHHLSASFNKLKEEEKLQLFVRNKHVYEAKWGEWIPHSYRA